MPSTSWPIGHAAFRPSAESSATSRAAPSTTTCMPMDRSRNPGECSSPGDGLCRVSYLYAKGPEPAALGAGVAVPGGWRVRLVDGTGIGVAGPGGKAMFRLHAAFDLAARRFDQLELTAGGEAESLARVTAGPGEVLVADRFTPRPRASIRWWHKAAMSWCAAG